MPESQAPTRIVTGDEDEPEGHRGGSAWTDPPPPDADRDPLLGTTLNHTYTLVRVLGSGGMGRVYEATHARIKKKRFAIKLLHPELSYSSEVRTRFQREAEAAACVAHPNAISIVDVALTSEGWPYLVCEFLEGRELAALLKASGRLAPSQAIDIAIQTSRALSEAHAGGIIHRDLKPHNVFLVGDFEHGMPEHVLVKVLDFGLSRFLEGDTELTKTGAIMGTPSYMAPEQARGERADHRTDVYGLGAILYACVTGRAPFRGDAPQAVLLAVMSQEPPRPSSLNPLIGPELELVIQRAMAREPEDRYPDIASFREALERLHMPGTDEISSAPRRRLPSSTALHVEAPGSARFDLSTTLLMALACATAAIAAAVSGAARLWFGGWPLTPTETLLALLVIVGTLLTPAALLLLRLRARVWGNTARVLELLQTTRRVLLLGLLTYGVLGMSLAFWDYVGAYTLGQWLPLGAATLSWPGLPLTLLAAATFVMGAGLWHEALVAQGGWVSKLGSDSVLRRRRWLAGPGVFGAGAALAAATVAVALTSRAPAPAIALEPVATNQVPLATSSDVPVATANEAEPAPPASSAAPPSASVSATAAPSATAPELASPAQVRGAIARGGDALVALRERYPDDPKVVRALGVQYAASAATLMQSLQTFSHLFALDPSATADKEVRQLVLQMTEISGPVSRRAYALLAEEMGHEGPDQLYRIALTDAGHKQAALAAIERARKAGTVSDALAIAMDLQFNDSCAKRVPLLPRAVEHGDQRSVTVLAALSASKRACGKRKKELCKPTCPAEAEQFRAAVDAISERLARTR